MGGGAAMPSNGLCWRDPKTPTSVTWQSALAIHAVQIACTLNSLRDLGHTNGLPMIYPSIDTSITRYKILQERIPRVYFIDHVLYIYTGEHYGQAAPT